VTSASDREHLEAAVRERLAAADVDGATERALRGYGPELLGWLHGTMRDEVAAGDAFALFAEELWKSLARFDGRCSIRTWCYVLARHAAHRVREARAANRAVPLSCAPIDAIAAEVRETTLVHLRTEVKDRVRALRLALDPDDQVLLTLRVDKDLGWRDIAHVLAGPDAPAAEIERHAATLRKRFERVKQRLRELAGAA
jgi:RNA polymerase sigma-70 factor (ECF subfamily)